MITPEMIDNMLEAFNAVSAAHVDKVRITFEYHNADGGEGTVTYAYQLTDEPEYMPEMFMHLTPPLCAWCDKEALAGHAFCETCQKEYDDMSGGA